MLYQKSAVPLRGFTTSETWTKQVLSKQNRGKSRTYSENSFPILLVTTPCGEITKAEEKGGGIS